MEPMLLALDTTAPLLGVSAKKPTEEGDVRDYARSRMEMIISPETRLREHGREARTPANTH